MHCPFCRHTDSRVIDSRTADDGASIRRRRQCPVSYTHLDVYKRQLLGNALDQVRGRLQRLVTEGSAAQTQLARAEAWAHRHGLVLTPDGRVLGAPGVVAAVPVDPAPGRAIAVAAVSYTHLDVYKRQATLEGLVRPTTSPISRRLGG